MVVATLVGQEGPATGIQFTDYLPRFKLEKMLKTAGVAYRVVGQAPDDKLAFKSGDILGKTLTANFKREEYNGKWSAKVQGYVQPTAGGSDDVPF
jgi:hypothetical protein